ncbi:class I SAM-dependent methyltransferase [Mycolicibacterium helvum]|uniref:Methyltransferase type 11 n=1 Tax=Mycolicibacterium helvum TaxID=1534349 RepID=A0A7I7TER1_9MYCO|nr:methyltransferase domain-containing protein [Mycolicibacterium helvum]BBY66919.1 methyltransferase type 11 [Mycolicibacterium helvum]
MSRYDRTGSTYSVTRRPDARIAAAIHDALTDMESVANIGAGTGSYETPRTVVAVEPSRVMIDQRTGGSPPAVQATAEHLPLGTGAVDATMAILTVHHWTDLAAGMAEMARVARRRVVVFTWEHEVFSRFWLLREYLPAAAETDARLAVPVRRLTSLLGEDRTVVVPVPVPHDCTDGFGGAYWRRPHLYLEAAAQAGMSLFASTPRRRLEEGLSRLRSDLADGSWQRRHADLARTTHLDLGYRLIVADVG